MVGATMIESSDQARISARSMVELLNAAYAIHPSFGEAEIIETGSGLRPAFPDNSPRLRVRGRTLYVNGLYRHGFLVAPALARDYTVVCADLRGYGDSSKPPGDPRHATYSKRAMAADMVEVMTRLGHEQFHLVGHDRGGRVAHRRARARPA